MIAAELDRIISEAPDKILDLLEDLRDNIMHAAAATLEETQDSETGKATLNIGLSLKINLHCNPVSWTVEAAVAVRHKVKSEAEVADTSPELMEGMGKGGKRK